MSKIFIKELNLISFGKFQNKSIKLNPNFNLIYGDNESGKSTISDFIEGVFYGEERLKRDLMKVPEKRIEYVLNEVNSFRFLEQDDDIVLVSLKVL